MVFVGDSGFSIDFPVLFDLTGMDNVRMLIRKPGGVETVYDFQPGELVGADVGGTLSYVVRSGDLTVRGEYLFQVISKDSSVDLGFPVFSLQVAPRVMGDWWRTA